MIDKFDIGLYDNGLASSGPGFFGTGVTNESLKERGKQLVASQWLNK